MALVAVAITSFPASAFADYASHATLPRTRFGLTGGIGVVWPRGASTIMHPDGSSSDVFSAGLGGDIRAGVQATEWLAFDAQLFGETGLLAGDGRAAALVEFAPADVFAFSLGAGVGGLYNVNFFFDNPTLGYRLLLLRGEARVPQPGSFSRRFDLVIAAEGFLGEALSGDLPAGTLVLGARIAGGLLWH